MKNKKFIIKLGLKIFFIFLVMAVTAVNINFAVRGIKKINLTMQEKKEMNYLIKNQSEINANIQKDFKNIDPDYEKKIMNSLPSVYNILTFVAVMDDLAARHSLEQVINFSQPTGPLEPTEPLKIFTINFTLTLNKVTIDNFINYLKEFEELPYFASIDNASLVGSGASGWLDNSSLTLSGKLYARQ